LAGITAGAQAAKVFGALRPRHGAQDWTVAGARVFVVANPSGANARGPWDGRERKVDWWIELARRVRAEP
jgi:TDG/mug DNA glycosylase family protein